MAATLKRAVSPVDREDSPSKVLKTEMSSALSRDEQQRKIFQNMRLRRIIKENHGQDITQLAFFFNNKNFLAPVGLDMQKTFDKHGSVQRDYTDTSNVLATVGGPQVNIYDNEHCGDHLDIMSNFNLASALEEGADNSHTTLYTFCWMYRVDDALIATAGADTNIHVVSLARSKEMAVLEGHTKRIHDIQSHPMNDQHILSASKDGTVRLWDIKAKKCLVIFQIECNVVCFDPSGKRFISGSSKGELREWTLPEDICATSTQTSEPLVLDKSNSRLLKRIHGDSPIDCIRFANGNVLSKSINGRMEYWNLDTGAVLQTFRIKTSEIHTRFDVSLDEAYFCVGTSQGRIYVYSLHTGKQIVELSHRRSSKAIRCCVFTRDCKQILGGGEGGFLWRYDYVTDDTLDQWKNWHKSQRRA
ncbi:WD40-repeat-containing domain protein [Gongronella butleri]|nr:WD40-repeat-containing domain protein [Gongronella butleri]